MVPLQGNESQIAEGVVRGFFEALNENNIDKCKETIHFPHFRVLKTGELVVFEDADKLMEWFYGKTNSDNWHHSILDKIETTIITSVKLHTIMHLTRYREDDTIIGHYQALYIITYDDDRWAVKGGSSDG